MLSNLRSFLGSKSAPKGPEFTEIKTVTAIKRHQDPEKQSFSKVFRWKLPAGQTEKPSAVEIVGSFTRWQKVQLNRDATMDAWHTTIGSIPGNKTHHYMLLIDGKPTYDQACDGLAIPVGSDEEGFAITTERGPRVLMLFSHTK